MDKINELINKLEQTINEGKINDAQSTLLFLITDITKYYTQTNMFNLNLNQNQNKCSNILDNDIIDKNYSRIKTIIPKYKYLLKSKELECSNITKKFKSINTNLLEFFNNTISVTPKLMFGENFDATLSKYDNDYFILLKNENIIDRINNNNKLSKKINKMNKILIITFDDRKNVEYIRLHNENFQKYAKKHGYEYKYEHTYNQNLNNNPYWYKIYLVKYYLDTNLYDYVLWVDSDTMILDDSINLNDYFNSYSSDLFFCDDNQDIQKINAGIFAIKNSKIGKQYINDCINNFCSSCIKSGEKKLKGRWAAICYEQGIMNLVLIKDYINYSSIFSLEMVYCTNNYYLIKILKDLFIIHYYDTTTSQRNILFNDIAKNIQSTNKLNDYS
jgi:hypothetical protein